MKIHATNVLGEPIQQGDRDWWALRLGIPTCSEFGRIMTAVKREYSKAARAYIAELLAEQWLGHPLDWGSTEWTQRGQEMEAKARQWYELERGVEVERVAFITDDEHTEGGSVDGLVGDDGVVEIKCRGAKAHMLCLLGEEPIASPLQVQGYLRLTGREWCDVVAFSEPSEITGKRLPPKLERVWRDDDYINSLSACLVQFKDDMAKVKEKLEALDRGGIVDDGGLRALLEASLKGRANSHPDALQPDEQDHFLARLRICMELGRLDDVDERNILADVRSGRWDNVRIMQKHLDRILALENVEVVP